MPYTNFTKIATPRSASFLFVTTAKPSIQIGIRRTVPPRLQELQKMKNPRQNPLLDAVKKHADNPQKLQKELQKLLNEGKEKVCNYLVDILSLHNKNSAEHLKGTARLAEGFAKSLGVLSPQQIENVKVAAYTHDIGKLYTPNYILEKPGKLNAQEWKEMQRHSDLGKELLEQLGLTTLNKSFKSAAELAAVHHKNTDINIKKSLAEEILELSDVFHALTKKRSYNEPKPPKAVLKTMTDMQQKEKRWSPTMFNLFKNYVETAYINKTTLNK